MKTVYKLKRFFSVLLALAIIFIGFGSNSVFASKGDAAKLNLGKKVYGNEVKFYPNELFEDADMNEIVFYSENQIPITKRDIITGNFETKMKIALRSVSEQMKIQLPRGKKSAIAKEVISVPRYSQTNEHLWLPNREGTKYATSIEAGSSEQILAFVSGFVPKIGWIIALPWGIKILVQGHMASEIRKVTDEGNAVEIVKSNSNYGSVFIARYWDGNKITVLKPKTESSPHMITKITVSYSFK